MKGSARQAQGEESAACNAAGFFNLTSIDKAKC